MFHLCWKYKPYYGTEKFTPCSHKYSIDHLKTKFYATYCFFSSDFLMLSQYLLSNIFKNIDRTFPICSFSPNIVPGKCIAWSMQLLYKYQTSFKHCSFIFLISWTRWRFFLPLSLAQWYIIPMFSELHKKLLYFSLQHKSHFNTKPFHYTYCNLHRNGAFIYVNTLCTYEMQQSFKSTASSFWLWQELLLLLSHWQQDNCMSMWWGWLFVRHGCRELRVWGSW